MKILTGKTYERKDGSILYVPAKALHCRSCPRMIFEGDKYEVTRTNSRTNYFCEDCSKKSVVVYQPTVRD